MPRSHLSGAGLQACLLWLLLWPALTAGQEFALTLTGDSIITQRLSVYEADPKFMAAVSAVRDGNAAFTNLEMLFHNYEPPPSAQSGGTWMAADPALFKELRWIGFTLFEIGRAHV